MFGTGPEGPSHDLSKKGLGDAVNTLRFGLFGALLALGSIGCGGSPSPGGTPPLEGGASEDAPIVATMHANQLLREFETNIVRATELYQGNRVRVNGTVNTISPDTRNGRALTALVFKSSITTYGHVFCRFAEERAASLASLQINDEATADGTVIGMDQGNLILASCLLP